MKYFILVTLISLLTSSCHFDHKRIKGNGTIKTETRSAGNFSGIDVSGNFDLYIKQDSTQSVRVEADENLMEHILIRTEGNELIVETKDNADLKGSSEIKVYVSSRVITKLDASGSCNIISENKISSSEMIGIDMSGACGIKLEVDAPRVKIELSGASMVALKGRTKDLSVDGSGSTEIKCMELMAENVDVHISGSGEAEVFASVKLDVSVSGAGDIKYKGNATVTKKVSGAGSVVKVE